MADQRNPHRLVRSLLHAPFLGCRAATGGRGKRTQPVRPAATFLVSASPVGRNGVLDRASPSITSKKRGSRHRCHMARQRTASRRWLHSTSSWTIFSRKSNGWYLARTAVFFSGRMPCYTCPSPRTALRISNPWRGQGSADSKDGCVMDGREKGCRLCVFRRP